MTLDFAKLVAEAVRTAGGRALIVGGFVRDTILGLPSKDVDIEVYGLAIDVLEAVLARLGEVHAVGKSFGVLKVNGCDVSVPRRDSKTGTGHRGFMTVPDPTMTVEDAARRRDFTMNSMAMDPLTGEVIDPFGGRQDLDLRVLRATDNRTFIEDPLRVLRAAQFISRFNLAPAVGLAELCISIQHTLPELPGERLFEEWVKLLVKGRWPSSGVDFMLKAGVFNTLFPEIKTLIGCQQDPEWHPEGDVFIHTCMALDAAAEQLNGDMAHDLPLMFGTLCHDFGKPSTTRFENGRWRSKGHEEAGIMPTTNFLERLRAPVDLIKQVCALTAHHLAPAHFANPKQMATPKAYRTLARKLEQAGTSMEMLYKVSKSDHFGRTTRDAIMREFPAGDQFLRTASDISVANQAEPDVVKGRHLIARGMQPGISFGAILSKCREVQYETGSKDPDEILRRVLPV